MKVIPGRRREFEISVVVDVEAADDYMRGASNPALDLCCWSFDRRLVKLHLIVLMLDSNPALLPSSWIRNSSYLKYCLRELWFMA
jgi:hypothetical protein